MLKKLGVLIGTVVVLLLCIPSVASADFSLENSDSFAGVPNTAIPINDLQISGTGTEPIPVKLLVSHGTLSMSTTTGLTFDGPSSGATLYFSGSKENINAALATLTYTRTSTGTDTLEVSLVPRGEVFFPENNHLYKFITGTITATDARTAALGQTAYGASGYLATVTSAEENAFIADRLVGDGWMGASDAGSEGDWKWLDGPEAGQSFWSGASGGNVVNGLYANWNSGEPNDSSSNEDCAQFYASTGRWNDLRCSNTLGGYVVEFGAPGDLPVVANTEITLNVVNAPTVSTRSPADNDTDVALDANLVLQFTQTVASGSGAVIIHKTADDAIVETIAVTSDQVTGHGTDTITINPSANFTDSTEYYVTIANTAFKNTYDINFAGISSTTAWSFTTGDFTDPSISTIESGAIDDTSATITWSTDEATSSQIEYGLTANLGSQTAETDTSPRVTDHHITLNALKACARYYYRVRSEDGSNNTAVSSVRSFTTQGCDVSEIEIGVEEAFTTTGGTLSFTHDSTTHTLTAPSGFYAEGATLQINQLARNSLPTAPSGRSLVDNSFLDLLAVSESDTTITNFSESITFTTSYSTSIEQSFIESTLDIYKYSNGTWIAQDCTVETSANTVTCTLDSFSIYALFGETLTPPSNSRSSSGSHSSKSTDTCSETAPQQIPDLFQIDTTQQTATLFFTPTLSTDTYVISYATHSSAEQHGGEVTLGREGVQRFTIDFLQPNTQYFFKVRGQFGCAPGEWSDIHSAYTHSIPSLATQTNPGETEEKTDEVSPETPSDTTPEQLPTTEQANYDVTITVKKDQEPLTNTTIVIPELEQEVTTNDFGEVTVRNVAKGSYTFKLVSQAYAAEEQITVEGDDQEFDVLIVAESTSKQKYMIAAALLGGLNILLILVLLLRRKQT